MSFFKELRTHLASFDTKAKAEVEAFIEHLETVFDGHVITAISHVHKSSVPPTKSDSAIPVAPAVSISPIQQQVIAAAQAAPVIVDTPAPVVEETPAPIVTADVAVITTTAPTVLAPTSIAPVAAPAATTVSA